MKGSSFYPTTIFMARSFLSTLANRYPMIFYRQHSLVLSRILCFSAFPIPFFEECSIYLILLAAQFRMERKKRMNLLLCLKCSLLERMQACNYWLYTGSNCTRYHIQIFSLKQRSDSFSGRDFLYECLNDLRFCCRYCNIWPWRNDLFASGSETDCLYQWQKKKTYP
jgi:hypothetical protein